MNNLIQFLQNRNLIFQITRKTELMKKIDMESISLYCGFDPTSDSLHIGHLIPLLCLKRFQLHGHKPIVLIGNATAMIGDPSFRKEKRQSLHINSLQDWTEKLTNQISKFFDSNNAKNKEIILSNYDWFKKIDVIKFLCTVGRYFSINQMIRKSCIRDRMNQEKNGISFSEFSYNLLQGYDFYCLHKRYGTILQIGGSDQWGNIISGIDLVNHLRKETAFGMTVPLLTRNNGEKIGKTKNELIWLDSNKTSPYKFYQFWINVEDDKIYQYLRFFTSMKIEEIEELERDSQKKNKKLRIPQKLLAQEITEMVHGKKGLDSARRITRSLFENNINNLTESDFSQLFKDGILSHSIEYGNKLEEILVQAKIATSKSQAKRMIISNSISINGMKQTFPKYVFKEQDRIYGRYTLIKVGKKNHLLLKWNH